MSDVKGQELTSRPSFEVYARGKLVKLSDGELVSRAAAGHHLAFEALMKRYMPMVLGFLAGKVSPSAEIDDLGQEIFLTAFRYLDKLQTGDKFGPWLMRIAHSRLMDFYRKGARSLKVVPLEGDSKSDRSQPSESLADQGRGPAERVSETQTREAIFEEIGRLNAKLREVLYPRLLGEESTPSIAGRLGLSPETVRTRLSRGIKKLRRALERRGVYRAQGPATERSEKPVVPERRIEP